MSKKVCKVKQGLLLLCCMVAATGCKQAPPAQMETEYEVMTVSPADRMISSAYSATIRGRQDIDIYPQVSGTLTKVCVTEGQRVKNGQTLFIIDQVPYEAALQTAVANVESAKASLDDRIAGLEQGIDDYITKPFSATYLKTRVASLLRQRKALQELYMNRLMEGKNTSSPDPLTPSQPQITPYDEQFMKKVMAYMEEQMLKECPLDFSLIGQKYWEEGDGFV